MNKVKISDHFYIILTILFTVYSQLIMRWQVSVAGPLPENADAKITYILNLLINPWVVTGVFATFLAGVSWMLTMTKFEISYAYPFVSLNYILILAAGILFFNESISPTKLMGSAVVIIGVLIISRG